MLVPAPKDRRCEFCRDRDADYRFGDYGILICKECLETIRGE